MIITILQKISFYSIEKYEYEDDEADLKLLITNKYDRVIEIQSDCITVNGYSFNDITMSDEVAAGKSGTICACIENFDFDLVDIKNIFNIGGELDVIVGGVFGKKNYHADVSFDYSK